MKQLLFYTLSIVGILAAVHQSALSHQVIAVIFSIGSFFVAASSDCTDCLN